MKDTVLVCWGRPTGVKKGCIRSAGMALVIIKGRGEEDSGRGASGGRGLRREEGEH
jgi:hypothetical protein